MIKCVKHRLINIFSFSDHAGRLDFFCVFVGSLIMYLPGAYLSLGIMRLFPQINVMPIYLIIFLILYVAINITNIFRRLNDLDLKAAYFLITFIPIINIFFIFYLFFFPSGKKIMTKF